MNAVNNQSNKQEPKNKDDLNKKLNDLYAKNKALILNIARNCFDIPAVFHFMGYEKFGPKTAGLCGTGSSAISIYNLWTK